MSAGRAAPRVARHEGMFGGGSKSLDPPAPAADRELTEQVQAKARGDKHVAGTMNDGLRGTRVLPVQSSDPPLKGVRVLELGTLIAGPFAGRLFADFGADVIKVERPETGDPLREWGRDANGLGSLWSLVQGRGKRSIDIDLHERSGQRIARALAISADVVIENFRPGRLEEWGLAPSDLLARNGRLVIVRISGYGQDGPSHDQAGFGTIAEAVGGLRYLTGEPDQPPTRAGVSLADSISGLYAVVGALLALRERDRSGRGQVVDVALTESVFSFLEGVLPEYSYFNTVRERSGNAAHHSAPTNTYTCGDGIDILVGANSTSLFRKLMAAIGRVDLGGDESLQNNQGRLRRSVELDSAIATWARGLSADEVLSALRTAGIPVARINSIADIAGDAQFRARNMLVEVDDPRLDRPILTPGVVPKLSLTPGIVHGLAHNVGEDREEILREVGSLLEALD
jgi:formyl-CoA transferase